MRVVGRTVGAGASPPALRGFAGHLPRGGAGKAAKRRKGRARKGRGQCTGADHHELNMNLPTPFQ